MGLSQQDFPDRKAVRPTPVLHGRHRILGWRRCRRDAGASVACRAAYRPTEMRPVGMPKGMPSYASQVRFRNKLATRAVDGASFSSATHSILAGYFESGSAFRTDKLAPTCPVNYIVLPNWGGMAGKPTRPGGPCDLPSDGL